MTDIFNDTSDKEGQIVAPEQTNVTEPVEPLKPNLTIPKELEEFVGEGKKYKSLDDAFKAFPHAQKHISTLEKELATLREELVKRKTAEDLIREMEKHSRSEPEETAQTPGLDVNQISQLVENILNKKTVEQTQSANVKKVVDVFKNTFGEKAKEKYEQLARDNGISLEDLDRMTKLSPQVVLNLAQIKPIAPSQGNKVFSDISSPLTSNQQQSSIKVGKYPTTKEVGRALAAAREAVLAQYK